MIVVNEASCPKNHPCPAVAYCPMGAISQESLFSAPRVDHSLCTGCGMCTRVCGTFSFSAEAAGVL
jgi:Fe-S-cluster-containing hydrogenase component 2